MSIAGVIANSVRGSSGSSIERPNELNRNSSGSITLMQIQIGLLANAKELQEDLRNLAASADTNTSNGLQKVLEDGPDILW